MAVSLSLYKYRLSSTHRHIPITVTDWVTARIPRKHVRFQSKPQKIITYLHHFVGMSIYVLWIHCRSLCIVYGSGKSFSFRCHWNRNSKMPFPVPQLRLRPSSQHSVPCATLRTGGCQVRHGRARNSSWGSRRQCILGIPTASLRQYIYGRGHGGYKQSQNSVLPYIQREECDHQPPYITDGFIICGARNLMRSVEGFNLASCHGGHVKHCCYFFCVNT